MKLLLVERWWIVRALMCMSFTFMSFCGNEPSRRHQPGQDTPPPHLTSSDEFWGSVDLPFSLIESRINSKNCYSSEKLFIACVQTSAYLASEIADEPLRLISKESIRTDSPFKREDFGPLTLAKIDPVEYEAEAVSVSLYRENRNKRLETYKKIYSLGEKAHVDFDSMSSELKKKIPREKVSAFTGESLNEWFVWTIDPHTTIAPTAELESFAYNNSESFAGIGMLFTEQGHLFVVESLVNGGPAKIAGVLVNDVLRAVDGKNVTGMKSVAVRDLIRGTPGTVVELTIVRGGQEFVFKMRRAQVDIHNVESEQFSFRGIPYTRIRINSFRKDTVCKDFENEYLKAVSAGSHGLIIDLRDNKGGYMEEASCIADFFVDDGKVIYSVQGTESSEFNETFIASPNSKINRPTVVLVNGCSASASEVLAGSLRDHQKAVIVGERTFGKGTTQKNWKNLPEDLKPFSAKLTMYKTVGQMVLPSGRGVQITGIDPSIKGINQTKHGERFREEDRYSNSIPSVDANSNWPMPDNGSLSQCVTTEGLANKAFQLGSNVEYEVLVASDALWCLAH